LDWIKIKFKKLGFSAPLNKVFVLLKSLVLAYLSVKVPQPGDNKVTFLIFS